MDDEPDVTKLLPPPTVVQIAWALTGNFSKKNTESVDIATRSLKQLDDIKKQAENFPEKQKEYISRITFSLESTMRTLDTIYKGRELNI